MPLTRRYRRRGRPAEPGFGDHGASSRIRSERGERRAAKPQGAQGAQGQTVMSRDPPEPGPRPGDPPSVAPGERRATTAWNHGEPGAATRRSRSSTTHAARPHGTTANPARRRGARGHRQPARPRTAHGTTANPTRRSRSSTTFAARTHGTTANPARRRDARIYRQRAWLDEPMDAPRHQHIDAPPRPSGCTVTTVGALVRDTVGSGARRCLCAAVALYITSCSEVVTQARGGAVDATTDLDEAVVDAGVDTDAADPFDVVAEMRAVDASDDDRLDAEDGRPERACAIPDSTPPDSPWGPPGALTLCTPGLDGMPCGLSPGDICCFSAPVVAYVCNRRRWGPCQFGESQCDGPEDCGRCGGICCDRSLAPWERESSCSDRCDEPAHVLCHVDTDCPAGFTCCGRRCAPRCE